MGKITYNVNFINPFLQAAIHVLQTMAHVQAKPEPPYLNVERKSIGDITGIIGITGYSKGYNVHHPGKGCYTQDREQHAF